MHRQSSLSSIPRRSRSVSRPSGTVECRSIQRQLCKVERSTSKMNRPPNISTRSRSVSCSSSAAIQLRPTKLQTSMEPKRLFRSNSNLALSARSNKSSCTSSSTVNKINTPQVRLDCKSPQQLKQFYTHLDESENISRITDFVAKKGSLFEVAKPLKISDFIGITQLLFSELRNGQELNIKNYKIEIPAVMKLLRYPIAITQNLLKSPNTSTNFSPVISIWTYMMDLVDACKGGLDEGNNMSELMCKYISGLSHKGDANDLRLSMLDSIYQCNGFTAESFEQLLKQCELDEQFLHGEEIKMYEKEKELQLSIDRNNECLKDMKMETDQTRENITQIDKNMQGIKGQIESSKSALEFYQKFVHDNESHLKIIKLKAAEVGHTPDEDDALSRELQYKLHHLQLLQKRYDENKEARRLAEDHDAELSRQALEYIFNYNNIIQKSKLPACQKKRFLLNETEINEAQIAQMAGTIEDFGEQLEKDGTSYREALNAATKELVDAETQLAEVMMAMEDAHKELMDLQEKHVQFIAERDNTLKVMEEEEGKITMLKGLRKKAKEKLEKTQKAALKNKEILQNVSKAIRQIVETRRKVILEKYEARTKRRVNDARELSDIVEETKKNIDDIMVKNNHPKLFEHV